ncbi:hypothetical protein DAA57_39325 [Bradyrhizobium yuanmingense]|nr:hypothetical protein DAA57_39325 [Bradyrhizobium yuanmingense]
MGVRTAVVASRGIERTLRTTGTVAARDAARETVTLRVGGFIERLYIDTEGQRVRQGQPLLEIYSPELVSTQQDLLLATRNRELLGGGAGADRLVEAARTRLRLFGLGAQQIAAVERSGRTFLHKTVHLWSSSTRPEGFHKSVHPFTNPCTLAHKTVHLSAQDRAPPSTRSCTFHHKTVHLWSRIWLRRNRMRRPKTY